MKRLVQWYIARKYGGKRLALKPPLGRPPWERKLLSYRLRKLVWRIDCWLHARYCREWIFSWIPMQFQAEIVVEKYDVDPNKVIPIIYKRKVKH